MIKIKKKMRIKEKIKNSKYSKIGWGMFFIGLILFIIFNCILFVINPFLGILLFSLAVIKGMFYAIFYKLPEKPTKRDRAYFLKYSLKCVNKWVLAFIFIFGVFLTIYKYSLFDIIIGSIMIIICSGFLFFIRYEGEVYNIKTSN